MATKTFNTRIQNKIDTFANWTTNNPVLLAGEVAIVTVPAEAGAVEQEPATLLKVGNGTSKFNELPWVSGLAANVFDWALQSTKPTYQATEIQGLDDYISGKVEDTNTTYQIIASGTNGIQLQSKEIGEGKWTNVGSPITITYTLAPGSANGTVAFNGSDVAVTGLKSAAYAEASAFDAAGAATAVQSAVTGTAEDAATALTLNGLKKYVDQEVGGAETAASEAIAALDAAAVTAAQGEIISAVSQTDGLISVSKRSLAAADIPEIGQEKVTGLTTALAGKQDTLVFNTAYNSESNKAATMTDIQNAVSGLSGAMHYVGESTTDPSTGTATVEGHEDWVSGDVVTYQSKEYVYDGENWRELGDESSYAIKGSIVDADIAPNANIAQSKIANLVTDLASKATPADITDAIQALDMASVSVTTGNKITSIQEVDGVVSVTTGAIVAADIPALAIDKITGLQSALDAKADNSAISTIGKTGVISDATQNEGDYLIFNCGSSSVVI